MGPVTASAYEIESLDELRAYETAWRKLHEECSQPTVFATWEWLWNWCRQFRTSEAAAEEGIFRGPVLLLVVHDENAEPVGMMPLYLSFRHKKSVLLTALRMVGDLEDASQNPFEEPLVLLKRNRERDAIAAIESYLQRIGTVSGWDYSRLSFPCFADSAGPSGLKHKAPGTIVLRDSLHTSEEVMLPGSYEALRRSLNKSMRDNLSYYPRLLKRRGHASTIRIAATPEDVQAATETLISLHRQRAAGVRGVPHDDHLPTKALQDFQRGCLADLAARGMASIYLLEVDGVAVAAQTVLRSSEGIYLYYSGFSADWYDFSPLTILLAEIFKDAIMAGDKRVNMLAHAKPWKTRWGAKSVDRFWRVTHLRLTVRSIRNCVAYGIVRTGVPHAPLRNDAGVMVL